MRPAVGQISTASIGIISSIQSTGTTTTIGGHTVLTGTNVLVATISAQDSNDANLPITGVTFGSSVMTKAIETRGNPNDTAASIWYMVNPPVTTASLVATATGNVEKLVVAFNLRGVIAQAPDVTTGTFGSAASIITSITPLEAYSTIIDVAAHKPGFSSIGSGQNLINTITNQSFEHNTTSYKIVETTDATTMSQAWTSANSFSYSLASFAPTVSILSRATTTSRTAAGTRTAAQI